MLLINHVTHKCVLKIDHLTDALLDTHINARKGPAMLREVNTFAI